MAFWMCGMPDLRWASSRDTLNKQVYNVHQKYNISDNGDFPVPGEIEIKETLIAVVLNNANCTVRTVQLTIAKLGLTKLNLNTSGAGGHGA